MAIIFQKPRTRKNREAAELISSQPPERSLIQALKAQKTDAFLMNNAGGVSGPDNMGGGMGRGRGGWGMP